MKKLSQKSINKFRISLLSAWHLGDVKKARKAIAKAIDMCEYSDIRTPWNMFTLTWALREVESGNWRDRANSPNIYQLMERGF
jgi:hypothetical protein